MFHECVDPSLNAHAASAKTSDDRIAGGDVGRGMEEA